MTVQHHDLPQGLTVSTLLSTLLPRPSDSLLAAREGAGRCCFVHASLGHVCFQAEAARPSGGEGMSRCKETHFPREEPKPGSGRASGTHLHWKDQRQQQPASVISFQRHTLGPIQLPLQPNPKKPLLDLHHRLLSCAHPFDTLQAHFFPAIVTGMVFQCNQQQVLPALFVLSLFHKTVGVNATKGRNRLSSGLSCSNNHTSPAATSDKMGGLKPEQVPGQ